MIRKTDWKDWKSGWDRQQSFSYPLGNNRFGYSD